MTTTNQHGLPRTIPEHVKRAVRQRCGFGCVVCGCAIVDYDHVDPPFAWATSHDPAGIALLCPQHHAEVTRKWMSRSAVVRASENPKCRQTGFSFGAMEGGEEPPILKLAGQTIVNCPVPILVKGAPLFAVEPPEARGEPYLFSGNFFDHRGRPILCIAHNEWRAEGSAWDVETTGGRVTIRTAPGEVALQIHFIPGHAVVVERISMHAHGYYFDGGPERLVIHTPGGGFMDMTRAMVSGSPVGIALG